MAEITRREFGHGLAAMALAPGVVSDASMVVPFKATGHYPFSRDNVLILSIAGFANTPNIRGETTFSIAVNYSGAFRRETISDWLEIKCCADLVGLQIFARTKNGVAKFVAVTTDRTGWKMTDEAWSTVYGRKSWR